MRKITRKVGLAAGLAAATAVSLGLSGAASADTSAPRNGDVVGVGSDTLQNGADFLFDGAPGVAGGYNILGNNHRVFSFDASGDANGRSTYDGTCGSASGSPTGLAPFCGSTSNAAPNLLPATVILRAGTDPVTRPNGSGAGVQALIKDSGSGGTKYQGLPNGSIQFARMSRLPKSDAGNNEEANCQTSDPACGGLHVYRFANDNLAIAARSASAGGTNAPAALSAQELVGIYQCTTTTWNALPGNSGGSTNTIHPLIPQSGSGTRNFFLDDLKAANGGTAITLGGCVRTVQEHDPTGIYQDTSPADTIEPFSTGKISLINSGYFQNAGYSGTGFPNGAFTPNFLTTLSGTAGDGNAAYNSTRGLYFVIRNVDLASTTPIQTGGTLNWAQYLFAGSADGTVTPWIARSETQALIQAAGFTPAYKDCGVNPQGTC